MKVLFFRLWFHLTVFLLLGIKGDEQENILRCVVCTLRERLFEHRDTPCQLTHCVFCDDSVQPVAGCIQKDSYVNSITCGEGMMYTASGCRHCPNESFKGDAKDEWYCTCNKGYVPVLNVTDASLVCKPNCYITTYWNATSRTCKPCPDGQYQDKPNQDKCNQCPSCNNANAFETLSNYCQHERERCIVETPTDTTPHGNVSANNITGAPNDRKSTTNTKSLIAVSVGVPAIAVIVIGVVVVVVSLTKRRSIKRRHTALNMNGRDVKGVSNNMYVMEYNYSAVQLDLTLPNNGKSYLSELNLYNVCQPNIKPKKTQEHTSNKPLAWVDNASYSHLPSWQLTGRRVAVQQNTDDVYDHAVHQTH